MAKVNGSGAPGLTTSRIPSRRSTLPIRREDPRLALLTPRERDVVRLVTAGACNKEIASRLAITEATVKVHLTTIFRKVGVTGRLPLAVFLLTGEPRRPVLLSPRGQLPGPIRAAAGLSAVRESRLGPRRES